MTKEERAEQSRLRAVEYQRRKRIKTLLFITGLVLYIVVPLIWNGAVEFGFVQPIRTPEFRDSLSLAGIAAIFLIWLTSDVLFPSSSKRKDEDKEEAAPTTSA